MTSRVTRRSILAATAGGLLLPRKGRAGFARPGKASYTGPLDIVPGAVVAYSQRRMAAAFAGSVVQIDNDDTVPNTEDFAADSNNAVDAAAIQAFIDAGNFDRWTVWYDQSGDASDLVVTGGSSLHWEASGIGFKPDLILASNSTFANTNSAFAGGACVIFAVERYATADGDAFFRMQSTEDNDNFLEIGNYYNVEGDFWVSILNAGNRVDWVTSGTVTPGTVTSLVEVAIDSSGNVTFLVDGTDMGAAIVSGTIRAVPAMPASTVSFRPGGAIERKSEVAMWGGMSAPNELAIRQNIALYYGIAL